MVTRDKNPNEFRTPQLEDLLGRLRSQKYAVQIVHGDFPLGKGHSLKLFCTEKGEPDAHFVLLGEQAPITLGDITRLELTSEERCFHPFKYWSWKRALFPVGVGMLSALAYLSVKTHFEKIQWGKAQWIISGAAIFCSVVASTSERRESRFLCDLKDGRYFTAIMSASGYETLRQLVEG